MKLHLGIFAVVLLLLPLAGLYLGGASLHPPASADLPDVGSVPATLRTSIMLMLYTLLINHVIKRITGNAPMDSRRGYFIRVSIASALTGWLFSYLNLFIDSWTVPQYGPMILQALLYTPLYALLAPAVLITRDLLSSFPALAASLTFRNTASGIPRLTRQRLLITVTFIGLTSGVIWPAQLFWLFWLSPLTLLMALQKRDETARSTSTDLSPAFFSALSGLFIGNLAVISYQSNAYLQINLPNIMVAQTGLALFGLLCLQLGKLLADTPELHPLQAAPATLLRKN